MGQQSAPPIESECPHCHGFWAEEREGLMTRHEDRWTPNRGHWTEPVEWYRVTYYECEVCGILQPHETEEISEGEYENLSGDLPEVG